MQCRANVRQILLGDSGRQQKVLEGYSEQGVPEKFELLVVGRAWILCEESRIAGVHGNAKHAVLEHQYRM